MSQTTLTKPATQEFTACLISAGRTLLRSPSKGNIPFTGPFGACKTPPSPTKSFPPSVEALLEATDHGLKKPTTIMTINSAGRTLFGRDLMDRPEEDQTDGWTEGIRALIGAEYTADNITEV